MVTAKLEHSNFYSYNSSLVSYLIIIVSLRLDLPCIYTAEWLATPMHRPTMSVLGDPTIVQCHHGRKLSEHATSQPSPPRSLRRAISIPAVSSLVKNSWNWAGDTLHTYRDGLSKEQRNHRAEIDDRKEVLYLRIKNVSTRHVPGVGECICRVTLSNSRAAGRVVRGMARFRQ
jgi:hypothetical protein